MTVLFGRSSGNGLFCLDHSQTAIKYILKSQLILRVHSFRKIIQQTISGVLNHFSMVLLNNRRHGIKKNGIILLYLVGSINITSISCRINNINKTYTVIVSTINKNNLFNIGVEIRRIIYHVFI